MCVPHRAQLMWLHPPPFSRCAPHPGHGFTPCSSRQRWNESFPPDAWSLYSAQLRPSCDST
ncbi:hypothetical protein C8Q73DRAFT_697053 [Cubamyces lactineus]|nr:hypothetical protein C8Q73DRAFT_697053 [Cubamyces lactineus]